MMKSTSPFEQFPRKSVTPAEILAAMKAADIAVREKAEAQKKLDLEHAETKRLEKLWLEEQARKKGPYVITEEDAEKARKEAD